MSGDGPIGDCGPVEGDEKPSSWTKIGQTEPARWICERRGGHFRSDSDVFGPSLSAMNTSLCGISLNRGASLPKLVASDPLRQVDGHVDAGVESDEGAAPLVADILDRVSVSMRDVADVLLAEILTA